MSAVKNVVIAAAGMGTRLGFGRPKCLIQVNGRTILEYQLDLLKSVENVFLVVGFCEEDVMDFAHKIRRDIIFVRNSDFQRTKTLESFHTAAKIIDDAAIFMDGDMIIEPESFGEFLSTAGQSDDMLIAVSKRISDDPVYCDVTGSDALTCRGFSYEKKSAFEWANVVSMPAKFMTGGNTHTFEHLKNFLPAQAKVIDRVEVDTPEDLAYAEKFLATNAWFHQRTGGKFNVNNWHRIWSNRKDTLANVDAKNFHAVFAELKRIDGFDLNGGVTAESLIRQHENLSDALNLTGGGVFEVGCGAGAHLYLFARDGFTVGGLDYSAALIDIAKKVLPAEKVSELICAGADELPTAKTFDAVISNSVFSYFDDLDYARRVLEKMFIKSRRSIAVLDIFDADFETELMAERRRTIANYDELYKDLPKKFYPRKFFEDFAARHGLKISFAANELENYVNAPFTYHCFMEKT